jgi:hypothetical protein
LQFAVVIIIAGVLFMTAKGGYVVARDFASTLVGAENGPEFTDQSIVTIRSVAKGVLGVVLALGYKLFRAWISPNTAQAEPEASLC